MWTSAKKKKVLTGLIVVVFSLHNQWCSHTKAACLLIQLDCLFRHCSIDWALSNLLQAATRKGGLYLIRQNTDVRYSTGAFLIACSLVYRSDTDQLSSGRFCRLKATTLAVLIYHEQAVSMNPSWRIRYNISQEVRSLDAKWCVLGVFRWKKQHHLLIVYPLQLALRDRYKRLSCLFALLLAPGSCSESKWMRYGRLARQPAIGFKGFECKIAIKALSSILSFNETDPIPIQVTTVSDAAAASASAETSAHNYTGEEDRRTRIKKWKSLAALTKRSVQTKNDQNRLKSASTWTKHWTGSHGRDTTAVSRYNFAVCHYGRPLDERARAFTKSDANNNRTS